MKEGKKGGKEGGREGGSREEGEREDLNFHIRKIRCDITGLAFLQI